MVFLNNNTDTAGEETPGENGQNENGEEEALESDSDDDTHGLTSYQFDSIEYFLYNPHNPDHARVIK